MALTDEVVETSDLEEQEVLRAPLSPVKVKREMKGAYQMSARGDDHPPWKRAKLCALGEESESPAHLGTFVPQELSPPGPIIFDLCGSPFDMDGEVLVETHTPTSLSSDSQRHITLSTSGSSSDPSRPLASRQQESPPIPSEIGSGSVILGGRSLSPTEAVSLKRHEGSMIQPLFSLPSSPPDSPLAPLAQPPLSHQASTSNIQLSHTGPQLTDAVSHRHGSIPIIERNATIGSRYPLRQRQPVQIAPYSVDKYHYKQALQGNPEAIVKAMSPERRRSGALDSYEEGGTLNEIRNPTEKTNRGSVVSFDLLRNKSRSAERAMEQISVYYPEILRDLSSTDDDSDEELRALSKEARDVRVRMAKENNQGKRVTQVLKKVKVRPFPDFEDLEHTTREGTGYHSSLGMFYPSPTEKIGSGSVRGGPPTAAITPPPTSTSSLYDNVLLKDSDLEWKMDHGPNMSDPKDLQSDASGSNSRSETLALDRKRLKVLNRMMPKSMIKHLVYEGGPTEFSKPRHYSGSASSDDGDRVPLRPGQTKVRKVGNIVPAPEIRGDPESSDSNVESSSDVEIIGPSKNPNTKQKNSEIISDADSETGYSATSSGADIDDEKIKTHLNDFDGENENLIDWMLQRTWTIGRSSNLTKGSHQSDIEIKRSRQSKFAFDIVTREGRKHGQARQTLLNFNNHASARSRPIDCSGDRHDISRALQKASKKKAKLRHAHQKVKGVYIFKGKTRIVSGMNEAQPFSSKLGDEAPAAPSPHHWANAFQPSDSNGLRDKRAIKNTGPTNISALIPCSRHATVADTKPKSPPPSHRETDPSFQNAVIDMGIHPLPPGIGFHQDTFIGKGWLREMIDVISKRAPAPEPTPCHLRAYSLHSDMGYDNFLQTLGDVCRHFMEFSIGLPEVEHNEQLNEWVVIIRVVCQLVSWYLGTIDDGQRQKLCLIVEQHVKDIVHHVQELKLNIKSLDIAILQLDWFAVELLARTSSGVFNSSTASPSVVYHMAISLLMDHLMELGVYSAFSAITRGDALNNSTVQGRCAELWVCIIHLLESLHPGNTQRGTFSFSSLLSASLQKREEPSIFETAEMVWKTIFCLCALSQFSVHGMTTSKPRLPSSWSTVLFAMRKIRLAMDSTADRTLPIPFLVRRDKYTRIISFRCFLLCEKWQWQLDNASELFNELAEVFRSRKFANLHYENLDYPYFMLRNDWSLLLTCEKNDTAFVLFLKLIVKAAKSGQCAMALPKIKKHLSLAIPVGSLPFTKATPPSKEELPMLFNRLGAVAIGIYLDPLNYKTRISHARTYVSFADADVTTRVAVIRGMMNLAILMRQIGLQLDATSEWIQEMSSILSDELRVAYEGKGIQAAERDRLQICIQMLLASVRRVLVPDPEKPSQYPEPTLISSLKPLLSNGHIGDEPKTVHEIRRLTATLLHARSRALPPPDQPRIFCNDPESQDEYGCSFEIDFDDPQLVAALGRGESPTPYEDKEKRLDTAIDDLRWFCCKRLSKFIQELKDKAPICGRVEVLDQWIYCWLGCADVSVRYARAKSWFLILQLRESWEITNDALRRRVDLGLATQLLRLHPMIYTTHGDMLFETFFESLAVYETTIEHEYISLLLSIDRLQHPLLQGLTVLKELENTSFNMSSAEFLSLRLPLLQGIFSNLNRGLEFENGEAMETFTKYLCKCFSAMRSIHLSLPESSHAYRSYAEWCSRVFASLQGLGRLRSHKKLAYWLNWGRCLDMIS